MHTRCAYVKPQKLSYAKGSWQNNNNNNVSKQENSNVNGKQQMENGKRQRQNVKRQYFRQQTTTRTATMADSKNIFAANLTQLCF